MNVNFSARVSDRELAVIVADSSLLGWGTLSLSTPIKNGSNMSPIRIVL